MNEIGCAIGDINHLTKMTVPGDDVLDAVIYLQITKKHAGLFLLGYHAHYGDLELRLWLNETRDLLDGLFCLLLNPL